MPRTNRGETEAVRLFTRTIKKLRVMDIHAEEVLGLKKRDFMPGIAERAVDEYYDKYFKGNIKEPK